MDTTFLISFQIFDVISLMESQIFATAFLILFKIFSRSDFNFSKSPVTRSIINSTGASVAFLMNSHAFCASCLIPFQIPFKFSFNFVKESVMVVTIVLIVGLASNDDNISFHALGIVSVKNSTIPSHAAKNPSLIAFKILFTPSRNHSHLLYKVTSAAIIAVITAITGCAVIIPSSPVTAVLIPSTNFVATPSFPDNFDSAPATADIPSDIWPITISSGPNAATRIPTTTITCCTPSGSAENLLTSAVISSATFWTIGASVSPI